ncbi:MAG TPA: DUF6789 family protein [Caulobacteraceae bacterium]|nr:DUF6789 family protein [Caulobacteraceae bacterium]
MRDRVQKGILAGLAATAALTILMLLKDIAGIAPRVDLVALLSGALELPVWASWIGHFLIGSVVWGALFALLAPRIPASTCTAKAVMFSIAAWLLMQLIILPMAGAGLFGLRYGGVAPLLTLALHVVYGLVLGAVYARLRGHWHEKSARGADAQGALRYTHY